MPQPVVDVEALSDKPFPPQPLPVDPYDEAIGVGDQTDAVSEGGYTSEASEALPAQEEKEKEEKKRKRK